MSLIPHAMLFQWRQQVTQVPTSYSQGRWKALPERHRLVDSSELDQRHSFADVRLGWSTDGVRIDCHVSGKSQPLEATTSDPLQAEGLQLWIDTRNTPGVHRANRFCHLIVANPTGGGSDQTEPQARMIEIPRCREKSPLADPRQLTVKSSIKSDGYTLQLWIPAGTLNGFDPDQSPVWGFFYAVRDRELGLQTIGVGDEFPFVSDPSLWQSIELK